MDDGPPVPRTWPRAAVLLGVVLSLGVLGIGPVVGIPVATVALACGRSPRAWAVAAAALLASWGGGPSDPLWYIERGWAWILGGWFAALTLRFPRAGFLPRALGALAGSAAAVVLLVGRWPRGWELVEEVLAGRILAAAGSAEQAMRLVSPEGAVPESSLEALALLSEGQLWLLPGLVGLSSVAALGAAWWIAGRWALGEPEPLAPLGAFRFPDPLVWALIGGIAITLWGLPEWRRFGGSLVLLMSGLYLVRGLGVAFGVRGGSLSGPGWLLLIVGLLLAAPAVLFGATLVGLGDTWLDLRSRAAIGSGGEDR